MNKAISEHLTPEQRAEIDALAALPEDQIKTGDIPEQRDWSGCAPWCAVSASQTADHAAARCRRD
jgi:hypothetical protein